MKKYLPLLLIILNTFTLSAQNRKDIGNFSQLKQYYNPSLTGQEGSQFRTLYRNQWTGFEDAPKTIVATAEFNFADLVKKKSYQLNTTTNSSNASQHGVGLLLLRESFGPYSETQVNLSYGAGVHLSEKLQLQWGTAVTYTSLALDGNKLTVDQENDPKYSNLLGQNNRTSKMDVNLGLTLATRNFYVGYALQNATKGKLMTSGDKFIEDMYAHRHNATAGFRGSITNDIGFVLNALYQHDKVNSGTLEGQLKAVYRDAFWLGGGYRNNLAYNAAAGIRINKLQISYLYETPVGDAATINKPTNEISLAYVLKPYTGSTNKGRISLW